MSRCYTTNPCEKSSPRDLPTGRGTCQGTRADPQRTRTLIGHKSLEGGEENHSPVDDRVGTETGSQGNELTLENHVGGSEYQIGRAQIGQERAVKRAEKEVRRSNPTKLIEMVKRGDTEVAAEHTPERE
ncbi:hypothetical protein RUM43_003302 [Polyplax serrata]|uniref:Uncharacterized protein n=1 Tax=Polyplax serrata TaxID=468196 RepID=A0AAN8P343_POLSC